MTDAPAAPPPSPRRLIRCPRCGGPSEYAPTNRFRPFCSERCRMLDLGAWASEAYRVAPPGAAADGFGAVDADAGAADVGIDGTGIPDPDRGNGSAPR